MADSMLLGGLMSCTHVFFVSLRLMHRPGAACSHDHYDVLYGSRSICHSVCTHLAILDFQFLFVARIGVAHETTDSISIYDYENTFDSIVPVHARMQSLWPAESERSASASI